MGTTCADEAFTRPTASAPACSHRTAVLGLATRMPHAHRDKRLCVARERVTGPRSEALAWESHEASPLPETTANYVCMINGHASCLVAS